LDLQILQKKASAMESLNLVNFLRNSNLVSSQTAETIAMEFIPKEIPAGQFLLKEGMISDEYVFLESGFMRAFAHDTEGNEVTTNFYTGNHLVFEVSSFFNRTRSKENIQAISDCTGRVISYRQLNNLFHTLPEFRDFGRSVLVRGFAGLKTRVLSMITETAETRYEALLDRNPEIFQHVPLKYIASYLGITDTSLSRIRKAFAKK
jgi:CRP-like cAMP-binding protein